MIANWIKIVFFKEFVQVTFVSYERKSRLFGTRQLIGYQLVSFISNFKKVENLRENKFFYL